MHNAPLISHRYHLRMRYKNTEYGFRVQFRMPKKVINETKVKIYLSKKLILNKHGGILFSTKLNSTLNVKGRLRIDYI